jgi:hypothetical protein
MLLVATCPSVAVVAHELLPEASSGAGRREAGTPEESKPSWLAFLLLSSRRVGALAGPLALRTATALFSPLADKAFLSSRSRAGDCLAAEIAFKRARSSSFSISCKQESTLFRINSLPTVVHTISGGRNSLEHSCLLLYLHLSTEYTQRTSFHFTSLSSLHYHPISGRSPVNLGAQNTRSCSGQSLIDLMSS